MSEKRCIKLIKSGLRTLTVSLDGLDEQHNWLRNDHHSFRKAVETITYAAQTKNLTFDVVTCVNKKKLTKLEQIKTRLLAQGVKD